MTEMKCADCRYWDPQRGRGYAHGLGECMKAVPWWEVTEWDQGDRFYKRKLLPQYEEQMMFVQDGSDYKAILLTAPDFFCAHYEKQP